MKAANRLEDYFAYHLAMIDVGDLDPAYPALLYLCDRYEFNVEQRFWLAFLYAATYHVPSAFYIYNEFPDAENVDLGRMNRWWKANRSRTVFQTDRRWIRSRNQFVPMVESYLNLTGVAEGNTQESFYARAFLSSDPVLTYQRAYEGMMNVHYMGRYALFLYLESVATLTGFPMQPQGLDLHNSQSTRNGICYAIGRDEWLCGHDYGRKDVPSEAYEILTQNLGMIVSELQNRRPDGTTDIWSAETSLCAYKKIHRGTRYLGYYIDRQHDEIAKMQANVPEGVDWTPLWDFRRGHYQPEWLRELRAANVVGDPKETRHDPSHWYRRPASYR